MNIESTEKIDRIDPALVLKLYGMFKNTEALVVEDDEETQTAMVGLLETFFKRVYVAPTVKAGMRIYTARKPQVVFLDISLPGGSGLDMAEKIRQNEAKIEMKGFGPQEIVIVSASDDPANVQKALELKVTDFLSKPLTPGKIQSILKDLAKRRATMKIQTTVTTTVGILDLYEQLASEELTTRSAIMHKALMRYLEEEGLADQLDFK